MIFLVEFNGGKNLSAKNATKPGSHGGHVGPSLSKKLSLGTWIQGPLVVFTASSLTHSEYTGCLKNSPFLHSSFPTPSSRPPGSSSETFLWA